MSLLHLGLRAFRYGIVRHSQHWLSNDSGDEKARLWRRFFRCGYVDFLNCWPDASPIFANDHYYCSPFLDCAICFLLVLFLAFYLAIGFLVVTHIISVKRGYPKGERQPFNNCRTSFFGASRALLWSLSFYGAVLAYFTPTEAAVVCVLYALVVGGFVHREFISRSARAACRSAIVRLRFCCLFVSPIYLATIFELSEVCLINRRIGFCRLQNTRFLSFSIILYCS